MAAKARAKPTDTECTILNAVWNRGKTTVRTVFEDLQESHDMGYTTVLKFMQIMTKKGLLVRDTSVRPQIYRAAEPKQKTQKTLMTDLLDRAFSGSPGTLALQALATRKSTPEELKEIRILLDKLEKGS
ncbi:MAG: BlaI/MecI/CopY family transcriptional regulator [Phycisphaerales bacterium]|jgi:predicted transcriptional regulator|nr:BlaI/MecI/CopY family transcriptional regulator [Phycisphaerales bacterium]